MVPLDNLGHVAGGTQRTHLADHRAGTVGLLQAVGAVALNNALIAVALADAGHVHTVAGGEDLGGELVAHLVLGAVVQTELFEHLLELSHTGLLLVAGLGLGELALSNGLITQLNGLIAILLGGLLLHHSAGPGLDHGHRDHAASLIEDLGHADLFADDRFLHVGFPPIKGYWLGELVLITPRLFATARTLGYCSANLTRPSL